MATQKRPLVNALVYNLVRREILVTRATDVSSERNPWILPGGLPPIEIPQNYHPDFLVSELQLHFPHIRIEPHPKFRDRERAFVHYTPRKDRGQRALHTHVYVFVTEDSTLPRGKQEARWIQVNEVDGLGELTKKVIRSYAEEGLEAV